MRRKWQRLFMVEEMDGIAGGLEEIGRSHNMSVPLCTEGILLVTFF